VHTEDALTRNLVLSNQQCGSRLFDKAASKWIDDFGNACRCYKESMQYGKRNNQTEATGQVGETDLHSVDDLILTSRE
jgi:hypothetical protein